MPGLDDHVADRLDDTFTVGVASADFSLGDVRDL